MSLNPFKDMSPIAVIKAALDLIHEPNEVFEIRIPKTRVGTLSGYFDDTSKAAIFCHREDAKLHQAIYATVNPVNDQLFARQANSLGVAQATTSDADIVHRRWFLLDFDPIRTVGISSTEGELELARLKALDVIDWLTSLGWPEPVQACSGNGWHLMYRIDMPNDEETKINIDFATKMLATIFSDPQVSVDTTVHNAARIWKVYGTTSRKGSDTVDRPHRVSMLQKVPSPIHCVDRELIVSLARPLLEAKPEEYKDQTGEFITDMFKWLSDRGVTVANGPRPMFGSEGQKWILSSCPFNPAHNQPIVGLVGNRPLFRCLHNSCSGNRWKEFREKIDPLYKDPNEILERLKAWCNSEADMPDGELLLVAAALGNKLHAVLRELKKHVPRGRYATIEALLKKQRQQYLKDTIGEHNEKGNLVGLLHRTMALQEAGEIPPYWIAEFDHRIRVGDVGDVKAAKATESDEIALVMKYHGLGDTWVKQSHTAQVIRHLAEQARCNPLKNYMLEKVWDGTERLGNWLPVYMGTKDDEYTRAIGRKWLISGVARAMQPGCQVDHMLILEGRQGVGKSRAARALGGPFYTEYSGSVHGTSAMKDLVATICGKVVVEMSELATMRRAEMESLKAMLTTKADDVRLSYERDVKTYPRTCIFIGTTNECGSAYITDMTGARRFWPVEVGAYGPVHIGRLEQDVEQLWAEAVLAYQAGEDWHSVPGELTIAEQSSRQLTVEEAEPWYGRIRKALTDPDAYAEAFSIVTTNRKEFGSIAVRAAPVGILLSTIIGLPIERQSGTDANRVRKVLENIGFKKVRPNQGWQGSSRAYDLTEDAVRHLWPAIISASSQAKFAKKYVEEDDQ